MYVALRNLGNTAIVLVGVLGLLDQIAHCSARSRSGFSYSGFIYTLAPANLLECAAYWATKSISRLCILQYSVPFVVNFSDEANLSYVILYVLYMVSRRWGGVDQWLFILTLRDFPCFAPVLYLCKRRPISLPKLSGVYVSLTCVGCWLSLYSFCMRWSLPSRMSPSHFPLVV